MFTSVVATSGHTFTSTDDPEIDVCLMCGAGYYLRPETDAPDETTGKYETVTGHFPDYCSGDTLQLHGYEPWCDRCESRECLHIRPCACAYCA